MRGKALFSALPYVFVELGPTNLLLVLLSVLLDFSRLIDVPVVSNHMRGIYECMSE